MDSASNQFPEHDFVAQCNSNGCDPEIKMRCESAQDNHHLLLFRKLGKIIAPFVGVVCIFRWILHNNGVICGSHLVFVESDLTRTQIHGNEQHTPDQQKQDSKINDSVRQQILVAVVSLNKKSSVFCSTKAS